MSLEQRLKARILEDGPISIADYMTACLHDPADGYYAVRPRLGEAGDFVTAPMVSQMFGELIGLWAAEVWTRMGAPAPFRLVEIGPGDGTLMQDLLRAGRVVPGFLAAADLWLVETSGPLRAAQDQRLAHARPRWAAHLDAVPDGAPLIVVANELLDCLPVRQFVHAPAGWAERRVGLDPSGELAFGLSPAPRGFEPPMDAPEGVVVEISPAQEAFADALARRIAADSGAALLVDYGRDRPEPGDTLQALSRHQKVDPLRTPGQADLTVHADFPAVAAAARAAGAGTTRTVTQGDFLRALGIEVRAAALARGQPERAAVIARQLARLTGEDQMGRLFKVLGVHSAGLILPGFEAS
ncbi:MAG TPA: class I SAM-dependent methyltransferase [Caulobacteraceae bacterium]|jgi:SAM-dependent MidA family methyltransferase|nr:class I SAM-dependent methyltransferase [Caulobacteraceae bacterium]